MSNDEMVKATEVAFSDYETNDRGLLIKLLSPDFAEGWETLLTTPMRNAGVIVPAQHLSATK
jgi:hypothetical protein